MTNPGARFLPDTLISTCAYSPGALMITWIVITIYFLTIVFLGWRSYPSGMPLSATCSGAISAACHPPRDEVGAALLPLQWGVVGKRDGVGHCSFTTRPVEPPVPGERYGAESSFRPSRKSCSERELIRRFDLQELELKFSRFRPR